MKDNDRPHRRSSCAEGERRQGAITVKNIYSTAAEEGTLNMFVKSLRETGLEEVLSRKEGPFTVFAPDDDAFRKLPAGMMEHLMADTEELTRIIKYHVALGMAMTGDIMNDSVMKTLEGLPLSLSSFGGIIVNDRAVVTRGDIECSNGVIHVVNAVLIPAVAGRT